MKRLRVTVGDKVYDVLVEVVGETSSSASVPVIQMPVRPAAASPIVASASPAASAAAPGDVVSPLAGKVVSVDVEPGASVKEGDQVATIEAMKMNTYVYASRAGRVAAVHVKPGDGVAEGQALLRLE